MHIEKPKCLFKSEPHGLRFAPSNQDRNGEHKYSIILYHAQNHVQHEESDSSAHS